MTPQQMADIIAAQANFFKAYERKKSEDAKMELVQGELNKQKRYLIATDGLAADLEKFRLAAYKKADDLEAARAAQYEVAAKANADLEHAQLAYIAAINASRQTGASEAV